MPRGRFQFGIASLLKTTVLAAFLCWVAMDLASRLWIVCILVCIAALRTGWSE